MKIPLFIILFVTGLSRAGPLDGLLIPLAERKVEESAGWWTFSDELVTFELPAEAKKVVVSQVGSPDVPKPGERNFSSHTMGQEPREHPFARLYRIQTADGERFGDVLVVDQPWFDEAFCFCGPIVAKQFAVDNGNLLEFSQMPDGIIKIAQATNGTHRAKLGEWTHTKISFPDYERIGASLRLNSPSKRTPDEWIEITRAKRETGLVGWLRVGMKAEDVRKIMGMPVKSDASGETYEAREVYHDGTGYLLSFTLSFSNGKLVKPGEGLLKTEDIVPPHQVPEEIQGLVGFWNRRFDEEKEKAPPKGVKPYVIPPDQIRQVKEAFHRDAPLAGGKQWGDWCELLLAMNKAGVRDQKAAEMIVRRFKESANLRISEAVEVIKSYKIPGRYVMAASLVDRSLDLPNEGKEGGDFLYIAWMAEEGGLLTRRHIRKAVDHRDAEIRSDALLLIDSLPREEARGIMKRRMVDPDPVVRERAIHVAWDLCGPADEGWLRKLAEQEKDSECRWKFSNLFLQLKEGR